MRGLMTLICMLGLLSPWVARAEPMDPPSAAAGEDAVEVTREGRIYRMTDERGRVIFTDSPPAGAKAREVTPQRPNIMTSPQRPAPSRQPQAAPVEQAASGYSGVVIQTPAPEQTFQNPQEPIGITVRLTPELRPGHQLRILHNGVPLAGRQLVQPERGAHTLVAQVLDDDGKVVAESDAVTVYVHRPSVLQGPAARRREAEDNKDKGKAGEELVQILPWYPAK